jgi:hypothetical protein
MIADCDTFYSMYTRKADIIQDDIRFNISVFNGSIFIAVILYSYTEKTVSGLTAGFYLLKISTSEQSITKKVVLANWAK